MVTADSFVLLGRGGANPSKAHYFRNGRPLSLCNMLNRSYIPGRWKDAADDEYWSVCQLCKRERHLLLQEQEEIAT